MGFLSSIFGSSGGGSTAAKHQEKIKAEIKNVHDTLGELEELEERFFQQTQNADKNSNSYRKEVAEIRSDLISEEKNLGQREKEIETLKEKLDQLADHKNTQATITWKKHNRELATSALKEIEQLREHLKKEIEETNKMVSAGSTESPAEAADRLFQALREDVNQDESATQDLERALESWDSTNY